MKYSQFSCFREQTNTQAAEPVVSENVGASLDRDNHVGEINVEGTTSHAVNDTEEDVSLVTF